LIIETILFIILGWLIGLVINHAADILPTRQPLRQRPSCKSCGTPFTRRQWSALLAGATGARACTHCGQPRERFTRSVIIELTVPLVFAFLLGRYGLSLYLGLISLYSAILILITVTDLEHRLIFNVVTIPAIFLAVVVAFTTPYLSWRSAMLGGGLAFVLVYLAWLLGTLVYGHGALGVGDITLATFLGLILGFPNIILSLIFGVFLGGLVAFILLATRRINRSSFIPYGPFLTITGWIMLIWGDEIWRYYFA
jgi:leader peptidase (prepilin peptidase)/N-methyltransferase